MSGMRYLIYLSSFHTPFHHDFFLLLFTFHVYSHDFHCNQPHPKNRPTKRTKKKEIVHTNLTLVPSFSKVYNKSFIIIIPL